MKKRTAYKPRALNPNPLNRNAGAPDKDKRRVLTTFLSSFDAMVNGTAPTREDWQNLSDAINTIDTLATAMQRVNPAEVMPDVSAAIDGMLRARDRRNAGEVMRLDEAGAAAVRAVIDYYEQAMDGLTHYEIAQAQHITSLRVRAIKKRPDCRAVSV